ncbi:hypothetical protein C0989_008057 [Termitomyces sp. Mn162]|nr:hypothetical protein C0989_008057 [Termitomyces sp. Mn162]
MSDPVAEKSGFLRKYMSGHPDTLVAYAKWFGKVQEPITSAEMTSINTKNGAKKEVYVPIEPPLKSYDDVKPRLLDMKATAQEKLGMIKVPQISSFRFPVDALGPASFGGALLYLFFAPIDGRSFWKHTGFLTGLAYVFATMIFGFPIWKDLRSRIQIARIDSVMKVQ